MKTLQKSIVFIALIALFASCQSKIDVKQTLSNLDTRKEIMDTIANNSEMSKEMMVLLMNGIHAKMLIMENHGTMMKMMNEDPAMMQSMMSDMMKKADSDTSMMSGMCKTMMGNPKMMDMMQKMKGMNMDMNKKKSMNKMEGMDKKMEMK